MISRVNKKWTLSLIFSLFLLGGCANQASYDYTQYRNHMPRSILVLPPVNNSIAVDASYIHLSTITRPLAEMGYYVFPVAVIDALMKENGLQNPAEMSQAPLNKIDEIIGADAVLYITIEEWGQKYNVLSSNTIVKALGVLIDVKTGTALWEGVTVVAEGSGDGGGGIAGAIAAALVEQIVDSATDRVKDVSMAVNYQMVNNRHRGLLPGPYRLEYDAYHRNK